MKTQTTIFGKEYCAIPLLENISFLQLLHFILKRTMLIIVLFFICNAFSQTSPPIAPVNPPTGGFDIDGDLLTNDNAGDWIFGSGTGGFVLQQVGGIWGPVDTSSTSFVRDDYNSQSDLSFTGGSSFDDNPNDWKWSTGKPTSKCDINTVLMHQTTDPVKSEKWLILGGDRLSTNGTSYIDFEFSQGQFTREDDGTFSSVGLESDGVTPIDLTSTNGRTPGDFVLSMEYSNGGTNANVHFYIWEQTGSAYQFVEKPIPGVGTYAYGATNGSGGVSVPFQAFGANTYISYAFVEAAVNIDAILNENCLSANIRTVFVKTKASDSYSAALKDFVDPIPVNFVFGSAQLEYDSPFCLEEGGTEAPITPASPSGVFSKDSPNLVWETPLMSDSSKSNDGVIDLENSLPGTYTITYTPTGGVCLTPATDTVTINPLPTPVDSPFTICTDETSTDLTLSNATVLDGESGVVAWYDGEPGNGGSLVGTPTTANLNTISDLWAEVTLSDTGCKSNVDISVTVNSLPTPVDSPFVICADETLTDLTLSDSTVLDGETGTVAWYDGEPGNGGSLVDSPTTADLNTISDLWAEVTLTETGCKASLDISVTVNALPTPADSPFVICADEISTDLTLSDSTVLDGETGTVVWYDGEPGNGGEVVGSPTTANLNIISDLWAEVTLTGTGCKSTVDISLTVNPLPTPVDSPFVICADETSTDLTLSDATVLDGEAGTVAWYDGEPGNGGVSVASPTTANLNTVGDLWAEVTLNDTSCKANVDISVTINPLPSPPTLSAVDATCSSPTGTITVTSATAGLAFSLDSVDPTAFTNITGVFNSVTPGSYIVRAMNTITGCISTAVPVDVDPAADAPSTPVIQVVQAASCSSAEIILEVMSPLDGSGVDYEYINTNESSENDDGAWQDAVQFTINAGDGFSIKARRKDDTTCVSDAATCEEEEVPAARMSATEDTSIKQLPSKTTIRAYPNPFNDQVNFKVLAPEDSKGSLELMNLLGQRVKMVFEGDLKQGENSYNVNLPALQNNTLIYVLTVNGERVTGKLIQSRR